MKIILSALLLAIGFSQVKAEITLIHNIKGYSFNHKQQLFQFSSIAFEKDKIIAVSSESLFNQYPEAKRINGKGKALLPGLIDAHGHLLGLGFSRLNIDVRGISSATKTANKVKTYSKNNPQLNWILGRGWNQVLWPDKNYPTAMILDKVISDRPVWLRRVDGHAGWANSRALKLAGINADTLAPEGGEIIRESKGNPTGIFIDNAMALIESKLPEFTKAESISALETAQEHLLSMGMTSMHDAGISYDTYQLYQQLAKDHQLKLRIYAMISATDPKLETMLSKGYIEDPGQFLSIRSIKVYADGALGSRGAALLAPYSDKPEHQGLLLTSEQQLSKLFKQISDHKFQINIHAIGDRANRIALNNFKNIQMTKNELPLRHRIEHAQVVNVKDIPLFKKYNIIASMQPTHATSDMNMAEDRVGKKRLAGAYAWRTFLNQGTPIAAGSDFPVELANPFFGLHAAVTRQDRNNHPENGWVGEQALSVKEALKAFTLDAAFASHQESIIGSLEKGKKADFILIDQDIFKVPSRELWKTQILQTWVEGKKVFEK